MAIFTLTSASGAPGVTTCALGLALSWPRDVMLVDGDRTASQAVLAGYLSGTATGGRGLTSLAQAYRDGLDLALDLPTHTVPLVPDGPGPKRSFVPGFGRPGSALLFEPVWPELTAALDELDEQGVDVIVDAGRWGAQGLPTALVTHSRALAFVTRSSLRALAALRLYAPSLAAIADGTAASQSGLIVVGAGMPYSVSEIREQFGLPVWLDVPWQPGDAAGLSDGVRLRDKASARPLARAMALGAGTLRGLAQRWDEQVGRLDAVQAGVMAHA